MEIGIQIYEKRIIMQFPYNEWHNRLEIYKTLFAFIKLRNLRCPPPIEVIIQILLEAYSKDPSFEIRGKCKIMIDSFENILHPQKESLTFKLQVENIINTTNSIEPQQTLKHKKPTESLQRKEDFHIFQSNIIDNSTVRISKASNGKESKFLPLEMLKTTYTVNFCAH